MTLPIIRKATLEDARRIAEIHVAGWRNAYQGIVPDDVLNKLSVDSSQAARQEGIRTGAEEIYVIDSGDMISGHLTIGNCRDEDKPNGVFELWGIYIDPDHIRKGYGQQLFNFCEDQAMRRGNHEIVIWVLRDNIIGRNFYEKNGYKPDGAVKYLERLSATEIRYCKAI